jgi:uncharacterized membrane protein YbaN (DUF454 family)
MTEKRSVVMNIKILKKYLLISIGSISLVLGIFGVLIPLLPTTPFLLLTSFCYIRSSDRLYKWLINHKIFGEYIYNYITYKAVKRSIKISGLIFLWITLVSSMLVVANVHIRIFLFIVGIGVSIHLVKLKTLDKDSIGPLNKY